MKLKLIIALVVTAITSVACSSVPVSAPMQANAASCVRIDSTKAAAYTDGKVRKVFNNEAGTVSILILSSAGTAWHGAGMHRSNCVQVTSNTVQCTQANGDRCIFTIGDGTFTRWTVLFQNSNYSYGDRMEYLNIKAAPTECPRI